MNRIKYYSHKKKMPVILLSILSGIDNERINEISNNITNPTIHEIVSLCLIFGLNRSILFADTETCLLYTSPSPRD
jgi:hypothetical protein